MLRIAFMGIRGIPARYGGFETFAEELAPRLASRGHDVTVYGRSNNVAHRYDGTWYKGVKLVVLPTVPLKYLDTVAHTCLSMLHAVFRNRYDIVLLMNAANAPFAWLPRLCGTRVVLNVDGIERLRRKWNRLGQFYYRMGEKLARWVPDAIVSDAKVIQEYFLREHQVSSVYISYGAEAERVESSHVLDMLGLRPRDYVLYVTRFEPENNPDLVIDAFARVRTDKRLVIVGDAPYSSAYKARLAEMAARDARVLLPGFIYGEGYRELQSHAYCYVQATEVGGTHPALLEAMGAGNCVIANRTPENLEVLGGCGLTYRKNDAEDLARQLTRVLEDPALLSDLGRRAMERVRLEYRWDEITRKYETLFLRLVDA